MSAVSINPIATCVSALSRAIRQLPDPEMRAPLLQSITWTIVAFAALWVAVGLGVHHWFVGWSTAVDWAIRVLGILAVPYISWLLFPSVATAILALYGERLVVAVDRRFYPELAPPPPTRWADQLRSVLRLFLLSILTLPAYLILPGANLVLFLVLNGYVLGRGYYDLVALRRLDWNDATHLWSKSRISFVLMGFVVAAMFSIPLANLLAPIVGTAAAVHLVQRYRVMITP